MKQRHKIGFIGLTLIVIICVPLYLWAKQFSSAHGYEGNAILMVIGVALVPTAAVLLWLYNLLMGNTTTKR